MLPRPLVQFCSAPLVHFHSALDNAVTRCRRQIVSGGYHMGKPHDGGPVGVYSEVQSMAYLSNRNEYEG